MSNRDPWDDHDDEYEKHRSAVVMIHNVILQIMIMRTDADVDEYTMNINDQ